ncbi:hypothetical protein MKK68_10240 [Methylobacterium sp. E-016]|uniref:hypothetical protein n=1 Tax=Methylobacterium sp. E-016 TaxID=2836556 RepID=UPI001FBB424A|nr:hypothetical protein [Methylobacterium sp. E-016]MCJ2076028.1 hypothetical protein [Methylobacterium sp. E-016]
MTLRSETPPAPGNLDFGEAPDSVNPTSAQLKADIDSGRTGDKASHGDVGAAPLGTCDEAGDKPPTPQRIKLARETEAASEQVRAAADVHGERSWVMPVFYSAIVAIPVVIGGALLLLR